MLISFIRVDHIFPHVFVFLLLNLILSSKDLTLLEEISDIAL
jgi:hypothetical protein